MLVSLKHRVYLSTNRFYQVLSAKTYSRHGFSIHGVVFDELHAQPNRKLFDVITKNFGDSRMSVFYASFSGYISYKLIFNSHSLYKCIPTQFLLPKQEHLLHILRFKMHFMKLHYTEVTIQKLNIAIFKIQLFIS